MGNLLLRGSEPLAVYRGATQIESAYLGSTFLRPQGGGGGGGSPYVAKAVRFDSAWLYRASSLVGVLDSPKGLYSGWLNPTYIESVLHSIVTWAQSSLITDGVPSVTHIRCQTGPRSDPGLMLYLTNSNGASFVEYYANFIFDGAWHNFIFGWDLTIPRLQIAIDGVLLETNIFDSGGSSQFDINSSAVGTTIFGETPSGFSAPGDTSDFYLDFSHTLDLSNPSNIAKFISGGKPVDLGADGSTPTGFAPTIFFSGDAASFGINKGVGGAFISVGSIIDATTSPSD